MKKNYPYYPVFLDIEERSVVIIGGGNVCARKAEAMMKYGARVTIVSPQVTDEIQQWLSAGVLTVRRKTYDESDLAEAAIVIASTDDQCVNARVARDCRRRKIPVNVVDVTHLCDFIIPAIVGRGSIQVAVSTGGKSPALARRLKEDLQKLVGPEYDEVNQIMGALRASAKKTLPTDADRKRFFDAIIAAGVLDLLREGRRDEAYRAVAAACEGAGVPSGDLLTRAQSE